MEFTRRTSAAPPSKSKFSRTFHKVIPLKTASKALSHSGLCLLIPQVKLKREFDRETQYSNDRDVDQNVGSSAATEAFVAKLFATISAVKAAYAELQMAQFPYDGDAIQSADEAVVGELKALSELKHSFLKKQIDSSPSHVTNLLAEIQEQQSMMKMYEITMKKMQTEIESKESEASILKRELNEAISVNKALEKRLNSSGCFSAIDKIRLSDWNPRDFITVLQYALRSIRSFVKLIIREMESAGWDVDEAVDAIQPNVVFPKAKYRCFAFESFVCREMFDGFDRPEFSLTNESSIQVRSHHRRALFSERFRRLKSVSPIHFLKLNPSSSFVKFVRCKYLRLVHPKMEEAFSGNLDSRKKITFGSVPETAFFGSFAEMAKRVWLFHCLAFSYDEEVQIFQVRKDCRFSEVYMESVTDDVFSATFAGDDDRTGGDFRVAFTVVPGFKIGETVIQSQVYLSPAR